MYHTLTIFLFLIFPHWVQYTPGSELEKVHLSDQRGDYEFHIDRLASLKRTDAAITYWWFKGNAIHYTTGGYSGALLHGPYVEYFVSNNLKEKGVFCNGVKEGEWSEWNESGQLLKVENWKNGRRHGTTRLFDEKGNLIEEVNYKRGTLHGKRVVHESDTTISTEKYRRGQLIGKDIRSKRWWKFWKKSEK